MGAMKIIVNIILRVVNVFVGFFSIKNNQVAFVSLEANKLESDLKLIYDKLSQDHSFVLKTVLLFGHTAGPVQNAGPTVPARANLWRAAGGCAKRRDKRNF